MKDSVGLMPPEMLNKLQARFRSSLIISVVTNELLLKYERIVLGREEFPHLGTSC